MENERAESNTHYYWRLSNGLCEQLQTCEQCACFCEHEQLSNLFLTRIRASEYKILRALFYFEWDHFIVVEKKIINLWFEPCTFCWVTARVKVLLERTVASDRQSVYLSTKSSSESE